MTRKNPEADRVRARLLSRTGMSIRAWSMARNYKPRNVHAALTRWAGRNRPPMGRIAFRVLRDMSQDIGEEIVPGLFDEAA